MAQKKLEKGSAWEILDKNGDGIVDDKEMAMKAARDLYTRRNEGNGIWIVKAENIISSDIIDGESFFDPSNDKVYRHPTFYEVPDGVKHI